MKKVVLIKSRLTFKGGLEKYTLKLAKHFASKGCFVTILTTSKEKREPYFLEENINVIPLINESKFTTYHLIRFGWSSLRWLKKNPSPLVFGMERYPFLTHYRAGSGVHAAYLKRRFQNEGALKKLSLLLNPLHYLLLYLEKKSLENPSLQYIFVNSEMVKSEMLSFYSVKESKIEVVLNGVSWQELEKPFLASFPKKTPFQFLFVGNGYARKGLPYLFPALAKLNEHNFHLLVIGREKNLSYYQELSAIYGLDKKITFLGPKEDLTPYYQQADVLVLPTLYDPFANVTLEALAMGLFVVSSPFNGANEILTTKSGIIIEDLFNSESVKISLEVALKHPKTPRSSLFIRNTIKDLEFSTQLDKIVAKVLF